MSAIDTLKKTLGKIEKDGDKIKGALYGFAIGDAMGATTEFMNKEEIKKEYGEVTDILGGGWLNLQPGGVTDDTQMSMCVMDALMAFKDGKYSRLEHFTKAIADNFVKWYKSNPPDVGNQCREGILKYMRTGKLKGDRIESALGNGGLMRAMPCALFQSVCLNVDQNNITHNNSICEEIIIAYHTMMRKLLKGETDKRIFRTDYNFTLCSPTGCVINTFANATHWVINTDTFRDAILRPVNHGGDTDTIAAITGSLAGCLYGYDNIPKEWIDKLDKEVTKKLDLFLDFLLTR